jgi:hypothetical protein
MINIILILTRGISSFSLILGIVGVMSLVEILLLW